MDDPGTEVRVSLVPGGLNADSPAIFYALHHT